jgi:hypothetical protein
VDFFVNGLGWKQIGGRQDYPAAFVSDGHTVLTLWQVADPTNPIPFNRQTNIGLHHLALKIGSSEDLDTLFAWIAPWPDLTIEFGPELSGKGPKRHFMIREPGGNRIEFAWDPR